MSHAETRSAPRRAPAQARSQETVQRVLAGTATLLARGVPLEVLTTAQIAVEAGLSVGALYRFFPDKQAIVDAIALRHMALFQEQLTARILLAFPGSPEAFLGTIIDAFAGYLEAHADFRTVAFGAPGGGRFVSRPTRDAFAASGEMAELVKSFLAEVFDIELTAAFDLRLRIATEIGDRLLAYAFEQATPETRRNVLEEAKRVLTLTVFQT